MRKMLGSALALLLVAGLVVAAPGGQEKKEGSEQASSPQTVWEASELPEGQAKAVIAVSGMTCGKCCVSVEQAVTKLEGVVAVKADYEKGIAKVIYQTDKVKVEDIVKTINEKTSFKASLPQKQVG